MSNLGLQSIYGIINNHPLFCCERAFFEHNKDVRSIETNRDPTEFDIIIFSVSFEIDFINIIKFLKKAKIELYRETRKKKPVLAAGGIAITLNFLPLLNIFDFFLIGEGEELVLEFLERFFEKENLLSVKGVINCELNNHTKRRIYKGDYICHSLISTSDTEFSDNFLIEIARGCPHKCKFCAVSYNYSPYRIKDYKSIINLISDYRKIFKKVGIVGASVTNHPDFLKITEWLNKNNIPFSVTSLRLDTVSEEIIDVLIKGGNTTFTVAVEACSDKLRDKLGKKLSDEKIFSAIEKFIKKKVLNLKIYIMIGFEFEEFNDIENIVAFVKEIKSLYLNKKKFLKNLGKITLSINPFVPKKNTPFYNMKMDNENSLNEKLKFITSNLKKIPNISITNEDIYKSYFQGLLSKGGERIDKLILDKALNNISDKRFFKKYFEVFKEYNVI